MFIPGIYVLVSVGNTFNLVISVLPPGVGVTVPVVVLDIGVVVGDGVTVPVVVLDIGVVVGDGVTVLLVVVILSGIWLVTGDEVTVLLVVNTFLYNNNKPLLLAIVI